MITDIPLKTEQDIMAGWQPSDKPMLSVVCIAYNHEAFIESTLHGFLMQQTQYSYEIICYDDCSTDNTRAVIQRFQQQYPKIIRTVFPEENKRSKGFAPFLDFVFPLCSGRYIARCEGDDYWSDCTKVEQQIAFLEQHPEFVLATHDIHTIDQHDKLISTNHLADFYKKDFDAFELRCGWGGPVTQSILFRNVIPVFPYEFKKPMLGDVFLASLLGQHGHSKYLSTIKPSMYRIHSGGVFSPAAMSDKFDIQGDTFYWMYKYYKRTGNVAEAKILKIKAIEKSLRDLSLTDAIKLLLVRFCRANLKNMFS